MRSLKFFGKLKRPKLYVRQVAGSSMQPVLRPGQLVIGWAGFRRLRTGDVVILRHNGLEKIKRIYKMRSNLIFIVGDNAELSTDSRSFGWLPQSSVLAKVIWPRP